MKRKLIVGIGGMGVSAVERFAERCKKASSESELRIETLVLDADASELEACRYANASGLLSGMTIDSKALDILMPEVVDKVFGPDARNHLFYPGAFMNVRRAAFLRFVLAIEKRWTHEQHRVENILNRLAADHNDFDEYEICVVASLAGCTGSALFHAVTLFFKRLLRERGVENVTAVAFLALPEAFIGGEYPASNAACMMANTYAALKELSLMVRTAYGGKKAPLRLGHPQARLGVLFDAQDVRYATPASLPFDWIFLIKKPRDTEGLAVKACREQAAELLYDYLYRPSFVHAMSAWSNHQALHIEELPSYLIEATGTSLRYPISGVKDKVLRQIALSAVRQSLEGGCDGGECDAVLRDYLGAVSTQLAPTMQTLKDNFRSYRADWEKTYSRKSDLAVGIFDSKRTREKKTTTVYDQYAECLETVKRCYRISVCEIEQKLSSVTSRMSSFLSWDHTDRGAASAFLKKDGSYRSPSEALSLLQALRDRIKAQLARDGEAVWRDLEKYTEHPTHCEHLLSLSPPSAGGRSAYLALGEDRFLRLSHMAKSEAIEYFAASRTALPLDSRAILDDTAEILDRITGKAVGQMETLALKVALVMLEEAVDSCRRALDTLKENLSHEQTLDAKRLTALFGKEDSRRVTVGMEEEHVSLILNRSANACHALNAEDSAKLSDAVGKAFCKSMLTENKGADSQRSVTDSSYEEAIALVKQAVASLSEINMLFASESAVRAAVPAHITEKESISSWITGLLNELLEKTASIPEQEGGHFEDTVLLFDQSFKRFLLNEGLISLDSDSAEDAARQLDQKVAAFLRRLAPSISRFVCCECAPVEWMRLTRFCFLDRSPAYFDSYRSAFAEWVERAEKKDAVYLNPGLFGNALFYFD